MVYLSVGQSVDVLGHLHYIGASCCFLDPGRVLEVSDFEVVPAPAFQAEFVTLD